MIDLVSDDNDSDKHFYYKFTDIPDFINEKEKVKLNDNINYHPFKYIIFISNIKNEHFSNNLLDVENRTIYTFDSCKRYTSSTTQKSFINNSKLLFSNQSNKVTNYVVPSIQQKNNYSCGFFSLMFAVLTCYHINKNDLIKVLKNHIMELTRFGSKKDWILFENFIQLKFIKVNKLINIYFNRYNPCESYVDFIEKKKKILNDFVVEYDNLFLKEIMNITNDELPEWFKTIISLEY